MDYRIESDSFGEMKVPKDKYWGAQTQRSLENFKISSEKMPMEIIRAFAVLKKSAALVNNKLGLLDKKTSDTISTVCDEILDGKLDGNFPLVVWQTGSGTQSNMNVNEVIANRGNEILGEKIIHPNDHVNKSQSSNDTFPTAMHIAAIVMLEDGLLPEIENLIKTFTKISEDNENVIKIGRTHLQDATPLTFGQEVSGWIRMLEKSEEMIKLSVDPLREIALGGTAVGTGLNSHPDFKDLVAKEISNVTKKEFVTSKNKFHSLTSKDELVFSHGALKALAADLIKIGNDVRFLASGPRAGFGEIEIPENEPGSSIMPGKVNPTQIEALTMACVQVLGNDVAIGIGASQGNFQLNVYMPLIIYNFLKSATLLKDSIRSFNDNCAVGIKPILKKMKENLDNSLMLVTALNPHIGYDNAAKIAKKAHKENLSLKESALELGILTEEEFDSFVKPEDMISSIKVEK
jgi:fumarate hydratase class II